MCFNKQNLEFHKVTSIFTSLARSIIFFLFCLKQVNSFSEIRVDEHIYIYMYIYIYIYIYYVYGSLIISVAKSPYEGRARPPRAQGPVRGPEPRRGRALLIIIS